MQDLSQVVQSNYCAAGAVFSSWSGCLTHGPAPVSCQTTVNTAGLPGHPEAAKTHFAVSLCMLRTHKCCTSAASKNGFSCCLLHGTCALSESMPQRLAIPLRLPAQLTLSPSSQLSFSQQPPLTCLPTAGSVPGHADLAAQAGAAQSSCSHLVGQLLRGLGQAALPGALCLSHTLSLQCICKLLHLQAPWTEGVSSLRLRWQTSRPTLRGLVQARHPLLQPRSVAAVHS